MTLLISIPIIMYEEVSLEESLSDEVRAGEELEHSHAAHVMVYAEWPGSLYAKYPFKYAVMVSLSLSGLLCCHGGWFRCR